MVLPSGDLPLVAVHRVGSQVGTRVKATVGDDVTWRSVMLKYTYRSPEMHSFEIDVELAV